MKYTLMANDSVRNRSKINHKLSNAQKSSFEYSHATVTENGNISSSHVSACACNDDDKPSVLLKDEEKHKKRSSALTRIWTSLLMMSCFLFIMWLGHPALVGLLLFIQIMMYKEVKRLVVVLSELSPLKTFRPLQWYWFFTAIFFSYGMILKMYFDYTIPFHSFVSFSLYISGVVAFVLSLKKGYYRYQFEMFAWVQLVLLLVIVQSTFIVVNMFQGVIWFFLPALLIMTNDTFAYFFGYFWGRTPLIELSPKKTQEGFIGAMIATLIVGFIFSGVLSNFQYFVCPKHDLTFAHPKCDPPYEFQMATYQIALPVSTLLNRIGIHITEVNLRPIQLHGLALAAFASIIGPFGGFFASGFKRAFGLKDFGQSIPGHGGITDRMDCQVIMGLFVFVYYWNFVHETSGIADVQTLMNGFHRLSSDEQLALYRQIGDSLRSVSLIK